MGYLEQVGELRLGNVERESGEMNFQVILMEVSLLKPPEDGRGPNIFMP